MFGRYEIRSIMALIWLFCFTALWLIFYSILPMSTMRTQLNKIEQSIEAKNWPKANEYTTALVATFKHKRMLVQMNNATEALTVFEHTLGQLETTVSHKQISALEYVGALREMINLVIKPFSGP